MAGSLGVKVPTVLCFRVVDDEVVTFSDFGSADRFDEWVKEASRPIIGDMTPLNRQRLLDVS